jgi:cell wall-associated NlpC family hydrolase
VIDGRKRHHARAAAIVTATLTTVGLGIAAASPATAAPDNDIDTAKTRVDRLAAQADTAAKNHNRAESKLTRARTKVDRLSKQIKHHREIVTDSRSAVAISAVEEVEEYGSGATSVPTRDLPKDSEVMLSNVTLVSEDTDGRGQAMVRSSERVEKLAERRADVRDQVSTLAPREKALRNQEAKVDSRVASAAAVVEDLEAKAEQKRLEAEQKRMAEAGGPAVAYAKAQVGKSYVYGAAGPDSFDCSGLTSAAWQQAGVSLPRSSSAQHAAGNKISESELQPGDLVFYYSPISHVGMYIGNGQIVNALNPGSGVQISGLHDMPYSGAVRPG